MELQELGTVCDLQNGYAFKSNDYVDLSETVSLRMSNIRPGGNFDNSYNLRYLPDTFREKYSKYLIKDGDLVIAMTDLANNPKILGIPTIVETGKNTWLLNQRAGKLVIKDASKADKSYLRYILNHPIHRNYYKMFSGGGLQINVGKKEILGCKIPLPPLKTQKQIANILDNAAALRDKTKQLLKEYDLLAQSIFLEMFGDPINNENKWEVKPLKNGILKISAGLSIGGELRKLNDNEIAVLKISSVTKGVFLSDEYKVVDRELINKDIIHPMKGDLLFSRANTREKIGATTIVDNDYYNLFIPDKLWKIDVNEKLNKVFLNFLLSHKGLRYNIGKLATGTSGSMLNISQGKLLKLNIPFPNKILQNQFAEKIALIEQQKALAKQELQESEDLFNCLLQKAFKGELV